MSEGSAREAEPERAPAPRLPEGIGVDERFRTWERVRKRSEFLRVQSSGIKATSGTVVVLAADGPMPWTRLGVTVSRKVGNAVVRSGVKRRLREIFRTTKVRWPKGADVVVIARPAAASATWDRLRGDVLACVRRVARERSP